MWRFTTKASAAIVAVAAVVVVTTFLMNHSAPKTQILSARLNDTASIPQKFSEDGGPGDKVGGKLCWFDSDVPRCD